MTNIVMFPVKPQTVDLIGRTLKITGLIFEHPELKRDLLAWLADDFDSCMLERGEHDHLIAIQCLIDAVLRPEARP